MTTTFRRPTTIRVKEGSVVRTCFACPTIFELQGEDGTPFYFRLRHGAFRFVDEATDTVLASGDAPGDLDGVCDLEEMRTMLAREGVYLLKLPPFPDRDATLF